MQPSWRSAAPRWRSGRRRSRSAGRAPGPGSRRRSAWRCSARSAGRRCGCPATGVSADRRPAARVASPSTCGGGSRGGGGAARGLAGRPARPARRLAAVHGRRALRDPRHQLQPGHVPAPAGHRPARRRPRRPADPPGLPARPALDRRRPEQGPRHRPGPGVQRPHHGDRGAGAADRARRLPELRPSRAPPAALVVGLAYVVASYFAQGAFKETIEALLVLAFVLALRESSRSLARPPAALRPRRPDRDRDRLRLQLPRPPLAARHASSGRSWTALAGCGWRGPRGGVRARAAFAPSAGPAGPSRRPRPLASSSFAVLRPRARPDDRLPQVRNLRPERPRPRQPLRPDLAVRGARDLALGRLPARARRRRRAGRRLLPRCGLRHRRSCSTASPAAGGAASERSSPASPSPSLAYLAARVGGTAYTAAKAIEIAAPLCASTILLPSPACARRAQVAKRGTTQWAGPSRGGRGGRRQGPSGRRPLAGRQDPPAPGCRGFPARRRACSLLALANAPVGPTSYSPALTALRPLVADGSTLVLAPDTCSPTNTAPTTSPGSCAAAESASRPAKKRPASRRRASATSSPTARRHSPLRRSARAQVRRPTCSGK